MKTVKRKAEVGEKVIGLRTETVYTAVEVTATTIYAREDEDDEGRIIKHGNYEVIIKEEPEHNAILTEIMDKFAGQTEKGVRKYGKTVDPDDYSTIEWIDHAIEESIDHIVYLTTLKQKIRERHDQP